MSKAKKTAKRPAAPDVVPATAVSADQDPRYDRLRLLHKRLGVAYGVQALAILLLTFGLSQTVPIHLNFDAASGGVGQLAWLDFSIIQILALPLAISGTFHIMQAHYVWPLYKAGLRANESPYRWLENAFSASMLPIAIGLLAGMRDAASIMMLFVLGFVTHLLGWQYERQVAAAQSQEARRTFAALAISSLAAWIATGSYVVTSAWQAGLTAYVSLAYGLALLFVAAFGWQLLQHGRGRWPDYTLVERRSMLLGFGAKSLIIWILFIGAF